MVSPRVSGVVLAAGPSRRFGHSPPKQLALFRGEPLVRRAARHACESRLDEVVVVCGLAASEVEASLEGLPVTIVRNHDYSQGQSTSVRVGLAALEQRAEAIVFLPIDQPWLSAELLDALVERHRETGAAIVVPVYGDRRGAPVLIDRTLFGELRSLQGDAGARQLFARHRERIAELALEAEEPLKDADSAAELAELAEGGG